MMIIDYYYRRLDTRCPFARNQWFRGGSAPPPLSPVMSTPLKQFTILQTQIEFLIILSMIYFLVLSSKVLDVLVKIKNSDLRTSSETKIQEYGLKSILKGNQWSHEMMGEKSFYFVDLYLELSSDLVTSPPLAAMGEL